MRESRFHLNDLCTPFVIICIVLTEELVKPNHLSIQGVIARLLQIFMVSKMIYDTQIGFDNIERVIDIEAVAPRISL